MNARFAAACVAGLLLSACEGVDAPIAPDADAAPVASDVVDPLTPARCVPGLSVTCACTDGQTGAQACSAYGTFDPCVCSRSAVDAAEADASAVDASGVSEGADGGRTDGGIDAAFPTIPRCVPGLSMECACVDGRMGAQSCRPDGTFDPCLCATSGASAPDGAAPDGSTAAESPIVEVAVGWGRSCVVRANGLVYCWGAWGGPGGGYLDSHLTPERAMGFRDVRAFGDATCAIRRDGTAICWDCDGCIEGASSAYPDPLPRVVPGVSSVTSIAVMDQGACYLRDGAAPMCCGDVPRPGAADAGTWGSYRPTPLEGLHDVAQLVGGDGTVCARLSSGQVWCWGYGEYNLGDGSTRHAECPVGSYRSTTDCALDPVRVVGIDDAVEITGGGGNSSYSALDTHFCVLHRTGAVSCWGTNITRYGDRGGALGDGTTMNRAAPVRVLGITDAVHIASRDHVSCALRRDGTVSCWGDNSVGQLGDGRWDHGDACGSSTHGDCSLTPTRVVGLDHVVQIVVSGGHACALQDSGRVFCWGNNRYGELGNESTSNSNVPVEVRWNP